MNPPQPAPDGTTRNGRILFMDDQEILQELVTAMLDYLGYDVDCAADGAEALERFAQARDAGQPFAAVILDLTVPSGMGGFETSQHLREMDPKVKVIVSSGYANDPMMGEWQKYGFDAAIAKPYKMEELGAVLREVIQRSA
jgi:CheY-like chemotaxis protein